MLVCISFYIPHGSSGNVPDISTFHGTPRLEDGFFFLTFKTSLSEEEIISTINVFTQIGAADSCANE